MGKPIDLAGMEFGKLTVIESAGSDKHKKRLWRCKCDCGNEVIVIASHLRSGNTKSCGRCGMIDLTGKRFGKLTVVGSAENNKDGKICFKCICDCGKEITVIKQHLLKGNTKSCGCLKIENPKKRIIDLTGKRFGKLLVIGHAKDDKDNKVLWECKCDCGKEITLSGGRLRGGKGSCGCLTEVNDITGQRFGRLLVTGRAENNKYGNIQFKCKCDCGKETIVQSSLLLNGNTISCGCYRKELIQKPFGEASFNHLLLGSKKQAERRNIEFSISEDEFRKLILDDCFYCGKKPSQQQHIKYQNGRLKYNGIDRIDNSKGYITGNVRTCCKQCNYLKYKYTEEEFLTWVKTVYENYVVK
jgi:ribosomal protein L13